MFLTDWLKTFDGVGYRLGTLAMQIFLKYLLLLD